MSFYSPQDSVSWWFYKRNSEHKEHNSDMGSLISDVRQCSHIGIFWSLSGIIIGRMCKQENWILRGSWSALKKNWSMRVKESTEFFLWCNEAQDIETKQNTQWPKVVAQQSGLHILPEKFYGRLGRWAQNTITTHEIPSFSFPSSSDMHSLSHKDNVQLFCMS